jgi:hypothetical protein
MGAFPGCADATALCALKELFEYCLVDCVGIALDSPFTAFDWKTTQC